ncbi:MAG: Omp28-related outer membrane protein [Candidatus Cryptobacteroides sp.]
MNKIITLLSTALSLFAVSSCTLTKDEVTDGGSFSKELSIEADTYVISADGISAAYITVKHGDEVVTDGVKFYDQNNKPTDQIDDMVFTTTTPGVYTFWASYKTLHTDKITIKAISSQIPSLSGDPEPSNTSFHKRVLINQFTGTECGFCPFMVNILRYFNADPDNKDKAVIAAMHSYTAKDPMYIESLLPTAMSINGYPAVVFNLDKSTKFSILTLDESYELNNRFQPIFDEEYSSSALAGISVATMVDGNQLVVNIEIKAAVAGEYKVAAYLLEDNILAAQANNGAQSDEGFNIHHNAIRATAGNRSNDFFGYGAELEKQGKYRQVYVFDIDDTWKMEDLHVAVYASYREITGFKVTNVVDCPAGETIPYQYK